MSRIKSLYKCFEHFQEHGNIIVFSDPHWGDSDRKSMGYNISEQEQCDKILAGARSGDTLICLGDCGDASWMNYINARRNLHTVLIMGNHDKHSLVDEYFDEVYEGPLFISPKILLSHEPILAPYYLNVHGHSHDGSKLDFSNSDSGVDKNRYTIGLNLAGNVTNFEPLNLNNYANNGGLKKIPDIHRATIDTATLRKRAREIIGAVSYLDVDI